MRKNIAIIGAGVMGKAIAKGLLERKIVSTKNLFLTNIAIEGLEEFSNQGVAISKDNLQAVKKADIILLTIKPQVMDVVLEEIKKYVSDKLIISIAAGISISHIQEFLGNDKKIIRVMPNLCAQVGESMSCWVAAQEVSKEEKLTAKEILTSIGKEIELSQESQIDIITPISGSGPAYVFLLAELLEKEAIALGIDEENARVLAKQTIIGSSAVLQNSSEHVEQLRQHVTSKGGVTEQVIKVFEEKNLRELFHEAIEKGFEKSKQLNKSK